MHRTTVRLLRTSVLLLTASLAHAQGDYAFRKTTAGTLGQTLTLAWSGAPANVSLVQMLSATAGPTALSVLDPADPRSLQVGLDAIGLWSIVPSGGSGAGTWSLPVPNTASLHGIGLHFQTCTVPGATTIVGKIGNRCFAQLGLAATPAALTASLPSGRALMATFKNAVLGPSQGDVILAGGGAGGLLGAVGLRTSDVYDAATMTARPGPLLTVARALNTSTVLQNGKVLLAGGVDQAGLVLASAELYDPATNTFTSTGSMSIARGAHAAALMADGRVLVVGGTTIFTDAVQALANAQATAEIYNPATGLWSAAAGMGVRRLAPGLDALPNGKILMSGGFEVTVILGIPIPTGSVATCKLYTPASNSWANAANMPNSRAVHSLNTLLMQDGRLLVSGGATSGPDLTQATAIAATDAYNAITNTWTQLPAMALPRSGHSVTQLADGRVFACGGAQGTLTAPTSLDLVQVFTPSTNTWSPALTPLSTTRAGHGAAVTPDGMLVLFGGNGGPTNTSLSSIETIHP